MAAPFPGRSPLLENKFIALLSSPRIRNVRLKQPVALSLGARNFSVIYGPENWNILQKRLKMENKFVIFRKVNEKRDFECNIFYKTC